MNIKLKNGQEVLLKEATKEYANEIIAFYNVVAGETAFLSFGKGEFNRNEDEYKNYLETVKSEKNSIMVLALANEKIIGIATISSNQKPRNKHVGILGIVIAKEYCNFGLGKYMMNYLIDWCKANGITKKISLVTNENNPVAIELYKKCGFEVEGIMKKEMYIDGDFVDSIMMSLIL